MLFCLFVWYLVLCEFWMSYSCHGQKELKFLLLVLAPQVGLCELFPGSIHSYDSVEIIWSLPFLASEDMLITDFPQESEKGMELYWCCTYWELAMESRWTVWLFRRDAVEQEDISSVTEIYWGHSGRREKTFMDVVTMGVRLPLKVYSVVRCLRI